MKQLRCSSCYKIMSAINFKCICEEGQICCTCCKKFVPHSHDERMLNWDEMALLNGIYVNNKLIDNVIVYNDTSWHEKINYLAKQPQPQCLTSIINF